MHGRDRLTGRPFLRSAARCCLRCKIRYRILLRFFSKFHRFSPTCKGSFSAVSKPIFATKYSFCSIFRDLQDYHSFAPLQIQYFSNFSSEGCNIIFKISSKILEERPEREVMSSFSAKKNTVWVDRDEFQRWSVD